jgi:hypothetical protein
MSDAPHPYDKGDTPTIGRPAGMWKRSDMVQAVLRKVFRLQIFRGRIQEPLGRLIRAGDTATRLASPLEAGVEADRCRPNARPTRRLLKTSLWWHDLEIA